MKVLYLDLNVRYIDPTRHTLPFVYASAADTAFFGPGYVSEEVLARGVERFIEDYGPFDVIATTDLVVYHPELPAVTFKYHQPCFPLSHLRHWAPMRRFFFDYRGHKIANLLESDYYPFTSRYIDPLRESGALFVSYNHQLIPPLRQMDTLCYETFAGAANDNFHDFIMEAPERFIPLITAMPESEFWFAPLADRPQRWGVPGAPYFARREARKYLRASGQYVEPRLTPFALYSLLDKCRLSPFSRRLPLMIYNMVFGVDLERTKYVYTCGSALGYPIRKFFEAPAKGCVLVCSPFFAAEEFGFVHNETMIAAAPKEAPAVGEYLDRHPEIAQSLADAGRRMVWEKHSIHARTRQLAHLLTAIVSGTFRNAVWSRGEFVVYAHDGRPIAEPACA